MHASRHVVRRRERRHRRSPARLARRVVHARVHGHVLRTPGIKLARIHLEVFLSFAKLLSQVAQTLEPTTQTKVRYRGGSRVKMSLCPRLIHT